MSFLPSLTTFKDLTKSLNPLTAFQDPPNPSTATSPSSSAIATPTAEAGPGPSSMRKAPPSSISVSPQRPPIPKSQLSSSEESISNGSAEGVAGSSEGRRKSSTVGFADEEVGRPVNGRRRTGERPVSVASGMTGISVGEGRRKKKQALDTYIIVKPPPTASKNPLNLQIQLVVKQSTSRGRQRSESAMSLRSASPSTTSPANTSPVKTPVDLPPTPSSADPTSAPALVDLSSSPSKKSEASSDDVPVTGTGAPLKRTSSRKSTASSTVTNTTLGSSFSGGGGAARKRVIPMFNLAVHNVMQPTVVTDAATDVKVAKFLKRSLDITGVGIIEPSEVWVPPSNVSSSLQLPPSSLAPPRSSEDGTIPGTQASGRARPLSIHSLGPPLSPSTTRLSGDPSTNKMSLDLKGFKLDLGRDGQEGGATKKFFGKVFKRKTGPENTAISRKSPSLTPEPGSPDLHPTRPSMSGPSGAATKATSGTGEGSIGHSTFGTAPQVVHRRSSGTIVTPDGAVTGLTGFGTTPTPSGFAQGHSTGQNGSTLGGEAEGYSTLPMVPSNRPVGYTWSVRKWAKRNTEGWAAHLVAAAAAGLDMVGGDIAGNGGEDEVVFEWVKLKVPPGAAGSSIMRRYSTAGTVSSRGAGSVGGGGGARSRSRPTSIREGPSPNASKTNLLPPAGKRSGSPTIPPPSPNLSIPDSRPEPLRRVSAGAVSLSSSSQHTMSDTHSFIGLSGKQTDEPLDEQAEHDTDDATTQGGYDSDPEDSETPWTCSVWVKKTGQRQLLGTLTPAPHHPKVIGVLKIPVNLESVSLVEVKPKPSANTGLSASGNGNASGGAGAHPFGQGIGKGLGTFLGREEKRIKEEVALTEENLKDVVCVTGMWLVAREEFGGLGRKKKP